MSYATQIQRKRAALLVYKRTSQLIQLGRGSPEVRSGTLKQNLPERALATAEQNFTLNIFTWHSKGA